MKKLLMLLVSVTLSVKSFAIVEKTENQGTLKALNKSLPELIDQQRIKYNLPALSVSVLLPSDAKPQNYVSGYLINGDKNKPINPETLFEIGSLTKLFTATIVMSLVEEKKFHLDDTLGTLLPMYPKWKDITVRELLLHTSGVYKVIDTPNFWQNFKASPNKQWEISKLVDLAYQYPSYFKPGEGYNYSNTDYLLLGLIIEKATHQPINQVFSEYLKKFGVPETYYTGQGFPEKIMGQLAHGYDDEGTFGNGVDVSNLSTSFTSSAGAIVSNPQNIILFLKKLFSGEIVSADSLRTMQMLVSEKNGSPIKSIESVLKSNTSSTDRWVDIGDGMGMGLLYFKDYGFSWVHAGSMPGYQSFYSYNPCTGVYVVLIYSKQPKENFVFLNIAESVFGAIQQSPTIHGEIAKYQETHHLPAYCQPMTSPQTSELLNKAE